LDVQERLSLETIAAETPIASEHVLRYELAAALCEGRDVLDLGCGTGYGSEILARRARSVVGVDIDAAAIAAASDAFGHLDNVEFVAADALEALDGGLERRFDAIVCFEVLEHLERLDDVLERLTNRAASGLALILSVPNSKTFDEDNPYHLADFDYWRFLELLERFPGAHPLFQFHAEGSLIVSSPVELAGGRVDAELRLGEHAEAEYANHFLAVVGWEAEELAAALARLRLAVAPAYNRYVRAIELSNRRLWRENARLARERIGSARSGAASLVAKVAELEARVRELESEREEVERSLREELDRASRERDRAVAILGTPRHRAVEAARRRLERHPFLHRIVRAAWGFVRPPRVD
jgi:2-polyprenyl-3-methyl-5-hydroxy-6-metoxy-1,4-benzoquinol methylase